MDDGAGGDKEMQRTVLRVTSRLGGLDPPDNVKVLMAADRPDALDPALTSPARLDGKSEFSLADLVCQASIFGSGWFNEC